MRFPARTGRSGAACHEVSARYRDYARVAAAAVVDLDADGELPVGDRGDAADRGPARSSLDCTDAMRDGGGVDGLLNGITPPDDIEASSAYRRRVAPVLAQRALRDAMAHAQGEEAA